MAVLTTHQRSCRIWLRVPCDKFARCVAFAALLIAVPNAVRAQERLSPPVVIPFPVTISPVDFLEDTKPTLAQQQIFQHRLELLLGSWQAWAATVAGPFTREQLEKIEENIQREVDSQSLAFAETSRLYRLPLFADDFPYLFLLSGRPQQPRSTFHVVTLEDRLGRGVLTAEQLDRLSAAGKDQIAHRSLAFRDLVISRIDAVAALTDAQHAMLRREMEIFLSRMDVPFFSLSPGKQFPADELYSLLSQQARVELPAVQVGSMRAVPQPLDNQPLRIPLTTIEEATKILDEEAIRHRTGLLERLESIIQGIEHTKEISAADSDRLRAAAKGVAVSLIDAWRSKIQTTMEPRFAAMRKVAIQGGTIAYTGPNISHPDLISQPLWLATLDEVLRTAKNRPVSENRVAFRSRARAGAVLTMLDHELWLTLEQREQLLPLVEPLLPDRDIVPNDENLSLIASLAFPLREISEKDQQRILNPEQREAWKALADYFQVERNLNVIRVSVRGRTSWITWQCVE